MLWRLDGIQAVFHLCSVYIRSTITSQSFCTLYIHTPAPSFLWQIVPQGEQALSFKPGRWTARGGCQRTLRVRLAFDPSQPGCALGQGWGKASVLCPSTFLGQLFLLQLLLPFLFETPYWSWSMHTKKAHSLKCTDHVLWTEHALVTRSFILVAAWCSTL